MAKSTSNENFRVHLFFELSVKVSLKILKKLPTLLRST